MSHGEDTATNDDADAMSDRRLAADATVNMEKFEEDRIPRVRGLIELIQQYLESRKASRP